MRSENNLNSPGLVHSSDEYPGFKRKKHGKGFTYLDKGGQRITDKIVLKRLKQLTIPPMWSDVWICPLPHGYLQATGKDIKGRKQYIYHDEWRMKRQQNKFEKLEDFAKELPLIRKEVEKQLRRKGWPRKKVIALVIGILDETYSRIGNQHYLQANGTYGLTTLRRKHMQIDKEGIHFEYKAKSQKMRKINILNKRFVKLIKECSELSGYEIFRYREKPGKTTPVDSTDVNQFLQNITREDFTSKNFRTWGGTILAIKKYPEALLKKKNNPRIKLRRAIVKEVAKELGNTIAVSEKYYIHPTVLDALDENFSPENYPLNTQPEDLETEEKLALAIINEEEID